MTALRFPCRIFETQKRMDDYGADDMRYGDLTETQLKNEYHLLDVSTRIDPYTLTEITPFRQPHSRFYGSRGAGAKHSTAECATILFDEMRHLSQAFAIYGPYKDLIEEMITHMQHGEGAPFSSPYLNSALRMHIINDESSENSTRMLLQDTFQLKIDWKNKIYPAADKAELKKLFQRESYQNSIGFRITLMAWALPYMIPGLLILPLNHSVLIMITTEPQLIIKSRIILVWMLTTY